MSDGYESLGRDTRGGCMFAAAAGFVALILDFSRFFGDPVPGAEDLWWRNIPFFVPTLIVVAITFLGVRAIIKRSNSDDR
jgi:hypothetical protein